MVCAPACDSSWREDGPGLGPSPGSHRFATRRPAARYRPAPGNRERRRAREDRPAHPERRKWVLTASMSDVTSPPSSSAWEKSAVNVHELPREGAGHDPSRHPGSLGRNVAEVRQQAPGGRLPVHLRAFDVEANEQALLIFDDFRLSRVDLEVPCRPRGRCWSPAPRG